MNLPNKLSIFRLVLVPVFVTFYFLDFPGSNYISAFVFLAAGITDIADGYIARKYNMITALGRVLDPLADKLLQVSALVCLLLSDRIALWIAMLFIVKEAFMLLGGTALYAKIKDVPASNIMGKLASFLFFGLLLLFICIPSIPRIIVDISFLVAFMLSAAAFIGYYINFRRIVKKSMKSGSDINK